MSFSRLIEVLKEVEVSRGYRRRTQDPRAYENEQKSPEETRGSYRSNENCETCHGLGYLRYDVDREDPNFGKHMMCPAPGCLKESWEAYRQGGEFLQTKGVARPQQTFETFRKLQGTEMAYQAMKLWAEGTKEFTLLLIYGGVGNGKTHLASAATILLNQNGTDCRYFIVGELMSALRGTIARGGDVEEEINTVRRFDALILDDYKPDLGTPFEQDVMERIINHRYAFCLPTVLITNVDVELLPERVKSRFLEKCLGKVVVNDGKDFRKK